MDREKVIKGIHQHCECSLFDRCGECPYYEFSDEQFSCRDRLLEDVLFLLKEQEARLYTFYELDHLPNEVDIWCEIKGEDRIFAQTTYDMWFSPNGRFRNAVWSKKIRYWTTRPTKKERKLVKWE